MIRGVETHNSKEYFYSERQTLEIKSIRFGYYGPIFQVQGKSSLRLLITIIAVKGQQCKMYGVDKFILSSV